MRVPFRAVEPVEHSDPAHEAMQVVLEREPDGTQHLEAVLRRERARALANAPAASVMTSGSACQLSATTERAARRATYTSARRCLTAWNAPMG